MASVNPEVEVGTENEIIAEIEEKVFFFHGRLICGPDPGGLLLTTVSILLSSWIFSVYVGEDLPSHHSGLIIRVSEMLTLLVLGNLILVSSIDPGIIPRNEQDLIEDVISGTNSARTRKKRVITVNGVELKLKYCRICKIFRPPRSSHCVVCDNCVEKFDHHCPWIGQCIALRNYRFYLTFIVSAFAFFVYVFSFSCWKMHKRVQKNGTNLFELLKNCPETLALTLFSFAAILFLAGLALFHVYLISTNQTAYENFRQRFVGSKSPYDKGILGNMKEVLFVGMPPSRVDFRAKVTPRSWHPTAASSHEV
ncbi:Zinc finger, DHHC-type, palmitoyltransferase [Trema orientale]|uniref:S-acyltransferase n=1 Tax=Trema orientale TaxID=63057 RepID=A0A2P5EE69_TREOI|nr:Zinc finger, DHHC-type, palmitoyltransferase [Trema orientale]